MRTGHTLSQRPQKVEALGRCPALSTPISDGREHRAHGAGIDPAIGVSADRVIDRAMVHAGAAADAAQHLLEARAEHGGAAVVDENHVVVLRPVRVRAAAGAGGEGGVDRHLLARGRAGEHAQELARVFQGRHELLEGREHDMRLRQDLREIAVALVGDDDRGAGLGHQEVRAGDAHIGREKTLAQHGARFGQQLHGLREIALGVEMGVDAPEILLHLRGVEVDGGRDDVARQLVPQLNDVFAEIRLDGRDAVRFQVMIDLDLLGDHRLALRHRLRASLAADAQDDVAGFLRVAGEMHVPAGGLHLLLVGFEVEVEMLQRVVLDVPRRIPQRLEFRQLVGGHLALVDEALLHVAQRLLQLAVVQRPRGILLELGRGGMNGHE